MANRRARASPPATPLTGRQREVLALVARGRTNREIGSILGITERGVAAQVSRMLAKYSVPNRAGLIARVMADDLGASSPSGDTELSALTPDLRRTCEPYDHSALQVGLTLGADNLIVYANEASRRATGIGVESRDSDAFRARRDSSGTRAFVKASKAAFRTGLPVSVQDAGARWRRDDGTWGSGAFSCVLQPVHRGGAIIGVLWICSPSSFAP
jgi:DNA-binding CsgD family transcriptional regulator